MSVFTETITEQIKQRKPRNEQFHNHNQEEIPISATLTDPNYPQSSRSSKSAISSLFLSPFSTTTKKKGSTFRGLGCTASAAQQVSVPAVIRSSAEWEGKRVKKKKNQHKLKKESAKICSENMLQASGGGDQLQSNSNSNNGDSSNGGFSGGNCMIMQDVWCGPGIGLSADAVVGSVDCVVAARRPVNNNNNNNNSGNRGKIDVDKISQRERERDRERSSCLGRRATVSLETLSLLDSEPPFLSSHPEPEFLGSRYYRHVRHPSPDGLAEIMLLQNSFMMGGRPDRFSDWRLDIDHMSYEQLLELGERIGYVSTGLKEDEIGRCVRKTKSPTVNDISFRLPLTPDKKCSICQEEYESDDEVGKLDCGHGFHIQCIKQWLAQKNTCPVCKIEPVPRG